MTDEQYPETIGPKVHRLVLEPVVNALQASGYYAYPTLDHESRWVVACDTEAGHVDVRVGQDGFDLEVWDTSPGLFWDEEDTRRREARERLARVSMPAISRGMFDPSQEIWWDEDAHGVGVRLRFELPFAAQERIGDVAQQRLAELNEVIAYVERRLID